MEENSFENQNPLKKFVDILRELDATIQKYFIELEKISQSRSNIEGQLDQSLIRIKNLVHNNDLTVGEARLREVAKQLDRESERYQNLFANLKVKEEWYESFSLVLSMLREECRNISN